MESKPDTQNVLYLDDYRREKFMTKLRAARESGEVAVFGALNEGLAEVIEFPQYTPDGAA